MTDLAHDMRRLAEISEAIAVLEAEAANIKSVYAKMEDGKYVAGDFILTVGRSKLFQPALAKKVLTKAEYAAILVEKPDPARARALLDPKKYAKCVKPSAPKFTLKPVDDKEDTE